MWQSATRTGRPAAWRRGYSLLGLALILLTLAVALALPAGARAFISPAAGATWSRQASDSGWQRSTISVSAGTPALYGIDMVDANVGWAAGDLSQAGTTYPDGLACVTSDGGVTWRQLTSAPANTRFLGVAAIGALDAWLVGFDGDLADWGLAMYRTADGGASWQRLSVTLAEYPACYLQFQDIGFVGSQLGWAIGGPT